MMLSYNVTSSSFLPTLLGRIACAVVVTMIYRTMRKPRTSKPWDRRGSRY